MLEKIKYFYKKHTQGIINFILSQFFYTIMFIELISQKLNYKGNSIVWIMFIFFTTINICNFLNDILLTNALTRFKEYLDKDSKYHTDIAKELYSIKSKIPIRDIIEKIKNN